VSRNIKKIKKLGVCDSGIGGFPLLHAARSLEFESYVYIGDTAHVPYGDRSTHEIIELSFKLIDFLIDKKVDAILIACNTICSVALQPLMLRYPHILFIEIVESTIKLALEVTQSNRIGVIGTQATINSEIFIRKINQLSPATKIFQKACPKLVPLIEEFPRNNKLILQIVEEDLKEISVAKIDTLILGCTHYIHISDLIQGYLGPNVKIVHAAQIVVSKLGNLAEPNNLKKGLSAVTVYTTGPRSILFEDYDIKVDTAIDIAD